MNFNQIKNISLKQKAALFFAIFFIIVFILSKFLIQPTINNIKNLRKTIITQKINLKKQSIPEKTPDDLEEKIKTIEPILNKFNRIFLNKNEELEFITGLEALAAQHNINQKINFDSNIKQTTEKDYKKIIITISATGSFENFIKYLNGLENMDNYININQLIINTISDNNVEKKINANLTAFTYWR